jgi:hypothetical protein
MNLTTLADALALHDLRLLPGSHAVPVELLVQLPDSTVAHFTARGTTIRLALHSPLDLSSVTLEPDCGCGRHHAPTGRPRTTLDPDAIPLAESYVDGIRTFGWRSHEAGLLRLPDALPHFHTLLAQAQAQALTPA